MEDSGATPLWTDAYLDEMREVGDPTADAAAKRIFDSPDLDDAQAFMAHLVDNDELPEFLAAEIAPAVKDL